LLSPVFLFCQYFAIMGDYRCGESNASNVAQLIIAKNAEFIVTTGDNFDLSCGTTLDYQIGQYYHDFIYPYTGIYGTGAATNNFFPSLGNHELYSTGLDEYYAYFELPGNERYYDFVRGNVHFFILNSNTVEADGTDPGSVQGSWLQNQMANSTAIWKFVVFHHPPYSSGPHGSSTYMQWPFKAWGADVVLCGHEHNYERLVVDTMLYLITGAGGAPLYAFPDTIPGSLFQYYENFGAIFAEANTDSVIFSFYNINDSLIDIFILKKNGLNILSESSGKLFRIFPNPSKDKIFIEYFLNEKCNVRIDLYELNGKLVSTILNREQTGGPKFFEYSIDRNKDGRIPSGVYIIKITAGKLSYSERLIVNE
ncbi:MAG: metallophosphoesterase, partial [Bacteroidota bacterium]